LRIITVNQFHEEVKKLKATGIVRRIDDLGRVVIPKEIRRTLRIREGDPLEIFTDAEGGVIFKKYSPVGEMSSFATEYAEVLSKTANLPALVCDCDHVIAAAGVSRKEYLERRVSPELEEYMHSRRNYVSSKAGTAPMQPIEGINKAALVVYPIIASSDVTGAVILLAGEEEIQPGDAEIKLAQAAASFLGKQMEE
jgi:AbrB family transcriptional regulator (stage V sporulation protein T)